MCRGERDEENGSKIVVVGGRMWPESSSEATEVVAGLNREEREEALDQTFKDIIGVDLPFGGKVMFFWGDFRQVLPVVTKGTSILCSFDSIQDNTRNLYQQEFLNSISPGGMQPHELTLKKGAPIMLLRNIDPKMGLCNGKFARTRVFLPRISLKTAESAALPFEMIRKQFPMKLSFTLTINKSRQTILNVGIYLPNHIFSHGQLYVALSRGVSIGTTKVFVKKGELTGQEGVFTKNVIYTDILRLSDS
ncbi:hypothetical protein PRUPE_4G269900 [Prunus persica]|uniref:ATP-dependent DNA helicase n=1 Tax=Prunus persica TaxID=3760 RepID=A0A251PRN0_PRUPE|nr:hypothetical protein PRUPE_4G269900 [Prunus persica]